MQEKEDIYSWLKTSGNQSDFSFLPFCGRLFGLLFRFKNIMLPCHLTKTFPLGSFSCDQLKSKGAFLYIVRKSKINPKEYRKQILHFFTRQLNLRSLRSWYIKESEESTMEACGFVSSFDTPWSQRSWIDLFNKETQNPFLDSFGFKNPILDFFIETHPK